MFKRKTMSFFMFMVIAVVVAVIASVLYSAQKESRDSYDMLKNGKQAAATAYELPQEDYKNSQYNKYGYLFTAEDGETYAGVTFGLFTAAVKDASFGFKVYYATDGDGKVKLNGDEKTTINGHEYQIALSRETAYFENNRRPSVTSGIVIFFVTGIFFGLGLYNAVWLLIYKNVNSTGELTYGVFVSASASKFGSAKYLSVVYKYQDKNGELIEAKTPYTFSALDAEKLKLLETFKIRCKGKRSVIAEDLKGFKL